MNKASAIIGTVTNWALLLRYRVTCARVLDSNRKFVEAAMRYYEVSTVRNAEVSGIFDYLSNVRFLS